MKVTVKGYEGDDENDVVLSVTVVDDEVIGAVSAPQKDTPAWMTSEQLRGLARAALALADRVDAANKALATPTEGGAK